MKTPSLLHIQLIAQSFLAAISGENERAVAPSIIQNQFNSFWLFFRTVCFDFGSSIICKTNDLFFLGAMLFSMPILTVG